MYLVVTLEGDGLKGKRKVEKRCEAATADDLWKQMAEFVFAYNPEARDIQDRGDAAHEEFDREQAVIRSASQAPHA